MSKGPVGVQETANWVAFYRALESERPDALFHDPYARALAGARGEQIVDEMPKGREFGWPMVVRTAVMDAIILSLVPKLDTVLNLAAGLDARPYRLALPPSLRWIEVDFPQTLEYKLGVLNEAVPRCVVERIPLDLSDRAARTKLFTQIAGESKRLLVVSEGLLVYLSSSEVGELADDLSSQQPFEFWLTDVASPWILRIMQRTWGKNLQAGGAPFKFGPEDAAGFFAAHGWRLTQYRSNLVEGRRLQREFGSAWIYHFFFAAMYRQEAKRRTGPMAGVVLLENAKHSV